MPSVGAEHVGDDRAIRALDFPGLEDRVSRRCRQAAIMWADASVPSMINPARARGTRKRPEPHMGSRILPRTACAFRAKKPRADGGAWGLSRSLNSVQMLP